MKCVSISCPHPFYAMHAVIWRHMLLTQRKTSSLVNWPTRLVSLLQGHLCIGKTLSPTAINSLVSIGMAKVKPTFIRNKIKSQSARRKCRWRWHQSRLAVRWHWVRIWPKYGQYTRTGWRFCLNRFLTVCGWIPYCLPVAAAVRCLLCRCLQDDIAIIRGSGQTWPTTSRTVGNVSCDMEPKCRDTTVADMPAFRIQIAWFCSSLFSLGNFFDLFQHNFIELWRLWKCLWGPILTPDMDMCCTKYTCKTTWVFCGNG